MDFRRALDRLVSSLQKGDQTMRELRDAALQAHVLADPQLPCHGCAHSIADAPWPGGPSGERPCLFCVRNPDGINPQALHPRPDSTVVDEPASKYAQRASQADPGDGIWYDGTPAFKTPMDCYIATDRLQQQRIFDALDRIERGEENVASRECFDTHPLAGDPGETWCCEGGPAPGGHTWTCWRWLGISFG